MNASTNLDDTRSPSDLRVDKFREGIEAYLIELGFVTGAFLPEGEFDEVVGMVAEYLGTVVFAALYVHEHETEVLP